MVICEQSLIKQSLAMAQFAKAAYSRYSYITFASWGYFDNYQIIQNKHTYAHAAANASSVIISFRGTRTKQLTDIIADVDLWPHTNGHSWVHRGFKRRADVIINSIHKYLENHKNKKIYITGHSMGAAIALHVTCELEQLGYSNIHLFSFGMPRVGNKQYCDLIASPHYRFVNCNDIVPKIPTSIMGYRHHGELFYLDYYGSISEFNMWQRTRDEFRARINFWRRGKVFDNFSNHKMGAYIKKLDALNQVLERSNKITP